MAKEKSQRIFFGTTDEPSTTDHLSFTSQVKGLSEFIRECPTPMTIAIQGGWGSGKSTILKLIDHELASTNREFPVITATIETWPLAHTHSEEDIPAAFVAEVFDRITPNAEQKRENRKRIFRTISPTIRRALTNIVGTALGPAGSAVSTGVNDALDALTQSGDSRAEAQQIQKDFESDVTRLLAGLDSKNVRNATGNRRLVIFVDDLDRLPPARAVQIMETLKLFISSQNCIFVLAIDFDVVADGTRAIYGDSMSQEKAKMFFHKIIQVPFNVPSPGREIEGYLQEIRKDWSGESDLTPWAAVAMGSLESNPRAIKRVFNAMSLLKLIRKNQGQGSAQEHPYNDEFFDFCLFTILCIQNADDTLATRLITDILEDETYRDYVPAEEEILDPDTDDLPPDGQPVSKSTSDNDIWKEPIGRTRFTAAELLKAHPMSAQLFNSSENETNNGPNSSERALKAASHLCSLTSLQQQPAAKKATTRPQPGLDSARTHFREHFQPKRGSWNSSPFDEVSAAFKAAGLADRIVVRASSNERLFFDLAPDIALPDNVQRRSRRIADLRFSTSGGFTPYINIPGERFTSIDTLNSHFLDSANSWLAQTFNSLDPIPDRMEEESWTGTARVIPTRNKGIGTDYQLARISDTASAKRFAHFLVENFRSTLEICDRNLTT